MQRKGYEYELCIAHIDKEKAAVRMRNLSLSSNGCFSTTKGTGFCDLGFCNIRYKGSFKPKVVEMGAYHKQF